MIGSPTVEPSPEIVAALSRLGLLRSGEKVRYTALTGGVSSDIWKVETPRQVFCVKRALEKLKVAQDWRAPVIRSRYEHAWITAARAIEPAAAPEPLGYDEQAGLIALRYYDPADYRLWKEELRQGRVDPAVAATLGRRLARIHAGTADRPEVAHDFATDAIFHAIRLEPYLVASGRAHPDLAARLEQLVETTARTRRVLVHGDVSPKNILVGADGPMMLDAECAWFGDPAFDAAFCLNHLLLKCLWRPDAHTRLMASFRGFAAAYLAGVTWESREDLESRIAQLLAGLFLARVDGKSPVEYVTEDRQRDQVRKVARHFLSSPSHRLDPIAQAWTEETNR